MSREPNQYDNSSHRSHSAEEGISPEHLLVRYSLKNLPRVNCPVGFEFRLQRKIEGKQFVENKSSVKHWTTAWGGLALGAAAAFMFAVFAFDVNFSGSPATQITPVQTASTIPLKAHQIPVSAPQENSSITGSPERLMASDVNEKDALTSAVKDSNKTEHRGTLPEGLYQVVGGNGR